MTDMIPRDAAAAACDKHSYSNNLYVSKRMAEAAAEIRAIPAIDPAAIREAALREAADSLRGMADFCKLMGDLAGATALYSAATALIGEKK